LKRTTGQSSSAAAAWLLAVGLLAVAGFAASAEPRFVDDSPGYLNPARAWASGRGLLEGNGEPLRYRLPAFPLALGILIRIAGESPRAFVLMNAAFLIAAALLVRQVLGACGRVTAAAAAFAVMVYPPLLTSTALVLQEPLVALLLTIVFGLTWRATTRPSVGASVAAGAAVGMAALAKTTVLPVGALLAILVGLARPRSWTRAAALAAGCALVMAPWAVRNQRVLGRADIAVGNAGHTLLGGTVSNAITDWSAFDEYVQARRDWEGDGRRQDPVLDRYLIRVALRRIVADPGRWLRLCVERAFRFMMPARTWFVQAGLSRTGTLGLLYVAATVANLTLFALAAALGIHALRRKQIPLLVGPIIVFGHLAVYALTYASPRYGVTVAPVLIATVALTLDALRSMATPPAHATASGAAP
jgi:4-amino-4-deoxy-L-arabinose transferase-like glycosyltransferase